MRGGGGGGLVSASVGLRPPPRALGPNQKRRDLFAEEAAALKEIGAGRCLMLGGGQGRSPSERDSGQAEVCQKWGRGLKQPLWRPPPPGRCFLSLAALCPAPPPLSAIDDVGHYGVWGGGPPTLPAEH